MFIDLNCDMAEGLPNDAQLMRYISSANIACGYHAGDEETMVKTIDSALECQVAIGAHPGFNDRENFGRTEIHLPEAQVFDLVAEQIYLLKKIAYVRGATLRHVKPHGALYNMSARDASLAHTIARAVREVDSGLLLFGLSGSHSISEAKKAGLETVSEVFADRTYQPSGALTPRAQPQAMISNEADAVQQVMQMIRSGTVTSVTGQPVPIVAETVCLHGDGAHAVAFVKQLFLTLQAENIAIKSC